ncbi:MAG: hypothetical protein HYY96_14780 [Candidatus Tectomicrobia bacterium]|nr:hypothetical protein [Candidatus Tectomicrobia bacterium]
MTSLRHAALAMALLLGCLPAGSPPAFAQAAKEAAAAPYRDTGNFAEDLKAFLTARGVMPAYEKLSRALDQVYRRQSPSSEYAKTSYLLRRVAAAFTDPVSLDQEARRTDLALRRAAGTLPGTAQEILRVAADHLDLAVERQAPPPPFPDPLTAEALFDYFELLFARARGVTRAAFSALSDSERAFLRRHAAELAARFVGHLYVNASAPRDVASRNLALLKLTEKLSYDSLLRAALDLAAGIDGKLLAALRQGVAAASPPAPRPGLSGDVLAVRETEYGLFVLGGPGPTRYDEDAALIIDLGGDDWYANNAGASISAAQAHAVLLDLAGDDHYMAPAGSPGAPRLASQGSGVFGVGLLFDLAGNDTYRGGRFAQGSGHFGVGVLFDGGGNDTYEAEEYAQGSGVVGIGLLIDAAGNDAYAAKLFAQGFGAVKGFGGLIELGGDDRYLAGQAHPSAWRHTDSHASMAQGFGIGHRGLTTGGIGVLLDAAGNDRYTCEEICQGGGYFLSLGMLLDGSGDDQYDATIYALGFGLHSAAGILIDAAGNDRYRVTKRNSQGDAWDAAVGIFIDERGDDHHEANVFGQGAGAQNGFGAFLDRAGSDTYVGVAVRGYAGGNWYGTDEEGGPTRGAASIGFFFDGGGARDLYHGPGDDDRTTVRPDLTIFIDQ